MDAQTKANLEKCGVNFDVTLERFMGNEDLYFKFLKKFLNDESYSLLLNCIDEKDFEKAFSAAHTLKGVSANLGLDNLNNSTQKIVEKFRAKDYEDYDGMLEEIKEQYDIAVDVIKQLQ